MGKESQCSEVHYCAKQYNSINFHCSVMKHLVYVHFKLFGFIEKIQQQQEDALTCSSVKRSAYNHSALQKSANNHSALQKSANYNCLYWYLSCIVFFICLVLYLYIYEFQLLGATMGNDPFLCICIFVCIGICLVLYLYVWKLQLLGGNNGQ